MVNNEQMGALLTGHSRQPVPSPSSYVVIGLLFFCPCISCPLLHNFVGYELTILWSLVKLPFWAWRSGKINWWTPYPEMHLLLRTHVVHLLALFLTKASPRLPCVFPFYIYSAHSSFFSLFHLCWLLRETKRETVACYFVVFSFRQHIFRHLTLRQYSDLPSKYILKVSFHFLAFFVCS